MWQSGDGSKVFIEYVCLFCGGGDVVVVCDAGLMSVRCVGVFVVEASNEPPEFGGICVVSDGVENMFPFCLLFVSDIITYFSV